MVKNPNHVVTGSQRDTTNAADSGALVEVGSTLIRQEKPFFAQPIKKMIIAAFILSPTENSLLKSSGN